MRGKKKRENKHEHSKKSNITFHCCSPPFIEIWEKIYNQYG